MKGYKTVVFFGIALVVAVANQFGFGGFVLTADQKDIIFLVVSTVGLVLRFYTEGKIFNQASG